MAVLFDFDGTLFDTSQDLHAAVNQLLAENNYPSVPYSQLRALISKGSKGVLSVVEDNPTDLIPRLIEICFEHGFRQSKPFEGVATMLDQLDKDNIPWGIVTNRLTSMTKPILTRHGYLEKTRCLVCGDTTDKIKPSPKPLLHAAELIGVNPNKCIYIGDSITDIQAGKAAGMRTIAAAFGFINPEEPVDTWQADTIVQQVPDILPRIREWVKA